MALDQMLNDVKNEVDKVYDLPDDADDPLCVKMEPEFAVITVGRIRRCLRGGAAGDGRPAEG